MVIKENCLFRHCSYHKLGDLSTTLEMTVLFITTTPLGQFMERSENSWRSQFMMPCSNSFKRVLLRLRGFLHALRLVEMTIYFYHHNFTKGETSLVIDKLHFPQENFTCNANFTIDSGFHPSRTDFIAKPRFALGDFSTRFTCMI